MGKEKKKTERQRPVDQHIMQRGSWNGAWEPYITFSWDLEGKEGGKTDQPPGVGEGGSFLARLERICY